MRRVNPRSAELEEKDIQVPNVKMVVPIPTNVATFPVLVRILFNLFKNLNVRGLSLSIS